MTEPQPDLLSAAAPKPAKKAAPKAKEPAPKKAAGHVAPSKTAPSKPPTGGSSVKPKREPKKTGTAVAVDDPAKRQQVAQQQAPSNFLAVVMQAATDPACDPAKMHSLLDFQERLEAREAKRAFDDAFVELQAELPSITRDRKIEVRAKDSSGERNGKLIQSTPYATFDGIHKAIKPLLAKHGFALSFSTEPTPNFERILVRTTLMRKGHSISTTFPLPAETSGSKNNVQGWGSAQSYGKRYGMIALLNIVSHAPEDADTDGHQGNFKRSTEGFAEVPEKPVLVSPAQVHELDLEMEDAGVSAANFCASYQIADVKDLPHALFEAAKKKLREHKAKKKANG